MGHTHRAEATDRLFRPVRRDNSVLSRLGIERRRINGCCTTLRNGALRTTVRNRGPIRKSSLLLNLFAERQLAQRSLVIFTTEVHAQHVDLGTIDHDGDIGRVLVADQPEPR